MAMKPTFHNNPVVESIGGAGGTAAISAVVDVVAVSPGFPGTTTAGASVAGVEVVVSVDDGDSVDDVMLNAPVMTLIIDAVLRHLVYMNRNIAVTIAPPHQFASMTNNLARTGSLVPPDSLPHKERGSLRHILDFIRTYGFLCIIFFMSIAPARAQLFPVDDGMFSRDIQVDKYVNNEIIDSWPWVDYGLYYSAILQMAYDPVLPPARWAAMKMAPDRLVVTERSRAGKLLRRFEVTDTSYVYTYQTYTDTYFRDLGALADQIKASMDILPKDKRGGDLSSDFRPAPITIMVKNTDQSDMRSVRGGDPALPSLTAMIKSGLSSARPLAALEELNSALKFSGPDVIHILIGADVEGLPDEIALENGQIRVRQSSSVMRGYLDRHNWRGVAIDQRRLYEAWRSQGIMTPPKEH